MISPQVIKAIALKWWKDVLISATTGISFFPREINRITRIRPGDTIRNFQKIQHDLNVLQENCREKKGFGYSILWDEIRSQKVGKNKFPRSVIFETLEDYLRFLRKEKEFSVFCSCYEKITQELPELEKWAQSNPEEVIKQDINWDDLLKVCRYFKDTPRPGQYIRQLPIDVHTKYIEENETIICSLLEHVIPDYLNPDQKDFKRRFNLRYDEPPVRMRFLDPSLAIQALTDITIPLGDLRAFNTSCKQVILTENKMNFLTLPYLRDTIAIWAGGGFNVKYIHDIDWLKPINIFYWGDIDTHGFLILNQMRTYYSQTRSIMMDWETFRALGALVRTGKKIANYELDNLLDREKTLYTYLKDNNLRLEQEKIPHVYALNHLEMLQGHLPGLRRNNT
ncbi:MAG: Wadjet anti-phage system protein JetD domain-containing protein [Cyclobacteriaceae bacterium]